MPLPDMGRGRPLPGSGLDLIDHISLPPAVGDGSAFRLLTTDSAKDIANAAESINGMVVAVVSVTTDKVRRYPYATLAAAQRRVDRAREAGHEASVILAELRPVFHVAGVVR